PIPCPQFLLRCYFPVPASFPFMPSGLVCSRLLPPFTVRCGPFRPHPAEFLRSPPFHSATSRPVPSRRLPSRPVPSRPVRSRSARSRPASAQPYRVLATGPTSGLVEFVAESTPLSAVLQQHAGLGILGYLRRHRGDPAGPLGVSRAAMDTYLRSTAGYCVLTYLLGVGDRHLDNIMMKTDGALFHIDFGFMFGKDPKLMPPPFRLTRDMVDAMGGLSSAHYTVFRSLCVRAYLCLRRSAHQFLNLLSLMVDAGIKDLKDDIGGTLEKIQGRFRLELSDADADRHFNSLIGQSLNALAPRVLEV
ncbi:unnamed protein product, partial [Phaeothamnion confervicola]